MKPKVGVHGVVEIREYGYGSFEDRRPEDFDFPCSPAFREFYHHQYGHHSQERIDRTVPERVEYKHSDLQPIRTIIRENKDLKDILCKVEQDVSGLKKGYHTHLQGKRKSYKDIL